MIRPTSAKKGRGKGEHTLAPIDLSMSVKIIPASSPSSVLTSTNATTPCSTVLFGLALSSSSAIAAIVAVDDDEGTTAEVLREGRMWEVELARGPAKDDVLTIPCEGRDETL